MANSAQLEREAEDTRARFAQTLDELRERITPGQLVDQAVDYAKDSGGGVFVRNLGNQVTANPLPVALIGVGMAWLMLTNGRRSATAASINRAAETAIDRARRSMSETAQQIKEFGQTASTVASEKAGAAGEWDEWRVSAGDGPSSGGRPFEGMADMADTARATAQQSARDAAARTRAAADSVADVAASAYDTAKSRASEAYGRVAGQAQQITADMTNAAPGFAQRTADASRDLLQFCRSQPLVLAGLGMALGAIIGTLIPATETEDALMGEKSDQVKDQVRDFADEQVGKAKSTAKSAAQTVAKSTVKSAVQAAQAGVNQADDEFDFAGSQTQTGGLPAETSLVPEAQHNTEENAAAESSNEPTGRER